MEKTITLGIAERVMLVGVFNQVKGDVETLAAVIEDVKEVGLTEEEKTEIGFREIKDKDGVTQSLAWDKTPQKEIKLSEKTVKFVTKFIDEKSKEEALTLGDAPLLEIKKKLS